MVATLFASLLWASAFAPPPHVSLWIQHECTRYSVPLRVAESVMYQESRGNQFAVHFNGNGTVDRGPWGINSDTLPWLEKRYFYGHPFNPYSWHDSTEAAVHYLADLYTTFGSWRRALEAYNGGPGPPVQQAVWYARDVLGRAEM